MTYTAEIKFNFVEIEIFQKWTTMSMRVYYIQFIQWIIKRKTDTNHFVMKKSSHIRFSSQIWFLV